MTLRTVTYDDSTHKIVPIEPTEAMIIAKPKPAGIEGQCCQSQKRNADIRKYQSMIAAAPEYQEPDIRAKLAINMIKYLGATKTQAKAIIDGVFDGEHTINESDLKCQEQYTDNRIAELEEKLQYYKSLVGATKTNFNFSDNTMVFRRRTIEDFINGLQEPTKDE